MKDSSASATKPAEMQPPPAGVLAFPASIAQQMFWYLEMLQGEVTAFNVPLRFKLAGPLDASLLKRTLDAIIDRHESLRTRFAEKDGELLQIVEPSVSVPLNVIDISHLPADRLQEETDRLGGIEARRAFQLAKCPLIRTELLRLSAESHILHVTVHHALFDGMSMTVLTHEIADIYQAYFEGKPNPLPPLALQYGDYSVWQKDFLESPETAAHLAYWKQKLAGMKEVDLPTDFPRPAVKSWKGEIISHLLPSSLTDRLHAIAASHGATLFHLQLAAYMVMLHRYSGDTDVCVGTPVTGRTRQELEPIIGVFINSLIIRGDLSGEPKFSDLVERVRDTSFEALEHQDLPFECLVREFKPERDPGRNPLFQVNFNHHRSFAKPGIFGGVTLTPIPSRSPGTIFDLHFFMVERKEGWRASCDFSTDLFSRESAERMLGHYIHLLEDIAENPETPLADLAILTNGEKHLLEDTWTGHTIPYPQDATLGALFEETAERYAKRTALVCGERETSYADLLRSASGVARALAAAGMKPGDFAAICTRPDEAMIAGFLGILMAGGCCVPLDPSYPADRFSLLLTDSGADFAVADVAGRAAFPQDWKGTFVSPDATTAEHFTLDRIAADSPSHLLFTSGSTGTPKGVLVTHRGIARLVKESDFLKIGSHDVFLQAAPASFDASLLEIFGALLNGAKLVLMPDGPGLEAIATAARHHQVSILWLTSGLFQLMIDEHAASLRSVRCLMAGGDVLSPPHVRKALDLLPHTTLLNGYGPTENTTFTTTHRITRADLEKPSIPIGKPIANTTVRILDELLRTVPVGIPGELFTGGHGLAAGYHNAPELTAEKFITHSRFGRLYRTGDLCRWQADGTIEFLGRRDHQVKVRGFRIELGEIESALLAHPAVKEARVAVRGADSETKRIFAWIVPQSGCGTQPQATPAASSRDSLTIDDLTAHLAQRLPAFMRPDGIAVIDSFPLGKTGKIDLRALPDPGQKTTASRTYEAPQDPLETRLATMWSELLNLEKIGRHDDFFALGGHSLMALRLFSRISRELGISLPLATLISHPTIAKLAPFLTQTAEPAAPGKVGNIVTLNSGGNDTPLFCVHGGDGGVIFYRSLADELPNSLPLHAIESLELSSCAPIEPRSVTETAAAYVRGMLAIRKSGPFRLAGYSFGGVVAQEMACQLVEAGHKVEFLGLFDTHNPASKHRVYSRLERLLVFWNHHSDIPTARRIGKLGGRIREGIATHRRVRSEQTAARLGGPAEAFSDLRRVQVREENWRSMKSHVPRVFPGRITLFRSTHKDDKIERATDYGWTPAAGDGLEIISVPGHHLALFSPENVGFLAKSLAACLPRRSSCG